ncbi:complement receptor type 2-like [Lacerta agilis]|uniref:complement receptor type 2-like n=1 Tax=Lacerta agilis TaxID=80427 RepID=UPI00141A180D|nr:complement receptor type 2-like [Lacerta agilis]
MSLNVKITAIPDLIRDEYTDLDCITETCLDKLAEKRAAAAAPFPSSRFLGPLCRFAFQLRRELRRRFLFFDAGRVSLSCDGAPSRLPWRGAVSVGAAVAAAADVFLAVQSSSFRTSSEFLFPSDCTHPHVGSATLRSGDPKDSYPAGTVLRYCCIPGYEPIPGETLSLTCLDTSKWSIENPRFCQGKFHLIRRQCTAVTIENGGIAIPSPMQIGDEITLGCNEGYRLIGEKTLRCVLVGDKAEWHTDPPICRRIRCYDPPIIEFGSHSGQPHEEYHYGSTVTYTCNEGFSLIGSRNSTCSASLTTGSTAGVWLPRPPKCKVVRCREPEIENGRVTTPTQDIYTYGDRASFECNPGYVMVGRSTCTCGPAHAWIPRFPKCVRGKYLTTPNWVP